MYFARLNATTSNLDSPSWRTQWTAVASANGIDH